MISTSKFHSSAGSIALVLALLLGSCGKIEPKDPRATGDAAGGRAEAKRRQAACASSAAYNRLKSIVFDQAIARHEDARASLDTLADYSLVRMEDPVVESWDAELDLTRCKGQFILQLPPGAERGFAGERRLQADVDYTAQAAADGNGFVYRLKGGEPIIARLAEFNLSSGAYRPPPAIDEAQGAGAAPLGDVPEPEPEAVRDEERQPVPERQRPPVSERVPERPAAQPERDPGTGEATVRAFYQALESGDGNAASAQVVPEKRSSRAFSPDAISRFYGRLAEPIRLTGVTPLASGVYRVRYRYSAGRSECDGSAVVRLANRGGRDLIRSIEALNGC